MRLVNNVNTATIEGIHALEWPIQSTDQDQIEDLGKDVKTIIYRCSAFKASELELFSSEFAKMSRNPKQVTIKPW